MTSIPDQNRRGLGFPTAPTLLTEQEQQAVWFLGALVRVRTHGSSTAGALAVLEHNGERGYASPLHRHRDDEETFIVLDGELRVEVDGASKSAGPGAAAILPRGVNHSFVVTSTDARFLTIHTPAGFEAFTIEAGVPAASLAVDPNVLPPDPAALAAMAARYGIDILGPPPAP
jgi:quercetin dioxygenase-like cupin family protein